MEIIQFLLTLLCSLLFIMTIFFNKSKMYDVTVVDNKAYWMYNNKLYTSKVINGKVDTLKRKKIDSMGMSEQDIHDVLRQMGSM